MLDGKVILVTGGARRLGAAIVEFAAGLGARTAIHYGSSAEEAERVAGTVTSNGGEAVVFQADLSDADAAQQLPGVVAEEMGGLDVLVNSAGILVKQPFGSVTAADWDRVFDINLRAYFFTAQGAAPMLRASRGSIINISDVAAFDAWVGFVPHCASKAGVEMLTKGLARELAPDVRVNGIAPGAVFVPDSWSDEHRARMATHTPLGRLGTPHAVCNAVRFLLETDYATGSTVVVDGGQLVRPRVKLY